MRAFLFLSDRAGSNPYPAGIRFDYWAGQPRKTSTQETPEGRGTWRYRVNPSLSATHSEVYSGDMVYTLYRRHGLHFVSNKRIGGRFNPALFFIIRLHKVTGISTAQKPAPIIRFPAKFPRIPQPSIFTRTEVRFYKIFTCL